MANSILKIAGGTVYDPANGIEGEVRDLWIDGERIIAPPADPTLKPARTLDAAGLIVMPGGVDMHCHIAGPKVNAARRMRPEEHRAAGPLNQQAAAQYNGSFPSVPTTLVTGARYAGLGYTTAFDAAIAPLTARHAHLELADTPYIDRGCFLLMGNNHYLMQALGSGEMERVRAFVAWLLRAGKGFAPKLVNPGGVEAWKSGRGPDAVDLDTPIDGFHVTPRQILSGIADAANELKLPHPLHVHANRLGVPGNWETTLETMKALDGRRTHLAHIQFHSYGGSPTRAGTFCSQVAPLVEWFNAHENLSVDVGQVLFGPTTSMTGDSAVGHYLSRLHGARWFSHDVECEAGCGVVPIEYRPHSLIHAWQWAIGLEWFLLARDPWRIALSTDHPNGGSFTAYPEIIRLLMDRTFRADMLRTVHRTVREKSVLAQLDRQYSLAEICIITRAAPARLLGLTSKGHLGPGADADVTLYTPAADPARTFELPRHVLKAGRFVIENGELQPHLFGRTWHVAPSFDPADEPDIHRWFNEHYSIRAANYPVDESQLGANQAVSCD
jgi:formylmethanofuran dehydrogenase subunit A